MMNPRCRVVGGSNRGSSAFAAIKGVAEFAEPRASSGPLTSQARQCDRNKIEHERGHHLVDAQAGTQEAWSHQPKAAHQGRHRQRGQDHDE
jgi:hypothetical protein